MPTKLPYEDKIVQNKDLFIPKVKGYCDMLGIKPEWLMVCMAIETVKTFRPDIVNEHTGATGLIQFMPDTARSLGTSCEELAKMKNVQQIDYVYYYFKPWKGKMRSFEDVYLVIFYPAAVGKPGDYIFGLTPNMQKKIAQVNPGYDVNKDMMIQKKEVREVISMFIPSEWKASFNS